MITNMKMNNKKFKHEEFHNNLQGKNNIQQGFSGPRPLKFGHGLWKFLDIISAENSWANSIAGPY